MRKSRLVTIGLCVIALLLNSCVDPVEPGVNTQGTELKDSTLRLSEDTLLTAPNRLAEDAVAPQEVEGAPLTGVPAIQVTLTAPHSTTSWDARDPDRLKFDLPLLYLHREREATDESERTLDIEIAGLETGAEITIEVLSRHVDRSTGDRHSATTSFVAPDRPCIAEDPCTIHWIFDATTMLGDFYYLRVKDNAGHLLWENPYSDRPDLVTLDTWDVGIGDYTVRVYYATLFPFAKGENDLENRLSPSSATDFIEYVFVPMVVDTWHTQLQEWGFGDPIQPDWDRDKMVEIIITYPPFALLDGTGPYTVFIDAERNPYPERRIWWPSSCNNYQAYDFLANGYKVTFAHEFFHLAQWNLLLSTGRPTNYALNVFLEAQGGFAPSVQYREIEIEKRHVVSDISEGRVANRFLALRLNSSYRDLEADRIYKYDAGLYWRFLYERYSDMGIIRTALEGMARYFDPDQRDRDIVASMGSIMNYAFERFDGPFHTFEGSLIAFARANYALRLENGRCAVADLAACDGYYYDPKGIYIDPPLGAELDYDGATLTYDGAVPTSFGMDFFEVRLDPAVQDQPLTVKFRGEGSVARFNVQLWKLAPGGTKPQAVTPRPEVIPQNQGGAHVYVISHLDRTTYDRLAFIITRLDPDETTDPVGGYHITLEPTGDTE